MITIRNGQVWMSLQRYNSGLMREVVGLTPDLKIQLLWRTKLRNLLRYTDMTPGYLRATHRLISCEHAADARDCTRCPCPFHGTEGCDCG